MICSHVASGLGLLPASAESREKPPYAVKLVLDRQARANYDDSIWGDSERVRLFTNARYSRQFDTIDFVKCKGTAGTEESSVSVLNSMQTPAATVAMSMDASDIEQFQS